MKYIADFHIHSRFSRATSPSLNLPSLDYWAERKGLQVVGTGDFTHPEWLGEMESQLQLSEDGLYRLSPEALAGGGGRTRFILTGEISSIYKKGGRVRKIHSLIIMPDLESAGRLMTKLDGIGNVRSDGRPILGLDARNLLEICLDISERTIFIPAHIWTPWFSLLGSKSGFDSVEECFDDLAGHIHALETGLSSDPAMNWRLSSLDSYTLVSNSDAHSPDKLGREANLFETDLDFPSIARALKGQGGFLGTIEFFPEEGKYHLDGHRKCGVRLDPEETIELKGLCPVCHKPLTVGVYNRVLELADRPSGISPAGAKPYHSLIPLPEVLGELLSVGPKSKRVVQAYDDLLMRLGAELYILQEAPLEDIEAAGGPLLREALERMRKGLIAADAGYDGEYGRIKVFEPNELEKLKGQTTLFAGSRSEKKRGRRPSVQAKASRENTKNNDNAPAGRNQVGGLDFSDPLIDDLNPEQKAAVTAPAGPLCVVAGPGTGKTLVLVRRIAWMIREKDLLPERILAITFTRQAAREMSGRLSGLLPFRPGVRSVEAMTYHALGMKILNETGDRPVELITEEEQAIVIKAAAKGSGIKAGPLANRISWLKQQLILPANVEDPGLSKAFHRYETNLADRGQLDFDDLLARTVRKLDADASLLQALRSRISMLLVDEYQDINLAQYRLTRLLAGAGQPNLMVIGDPDQAIYGFRGADSEYFESIVQDFPEMKIIRLTRNYRSTEAILKASGQIISHNPDDERLPLTSEIKGPAKITTAALASPKAEAEYVVAKIEQLLGGSSHYALDSGRTDGQGGEDVGLGDIAVLYRIHALAPPLAEALVRAGLPFQQAGREELRETDGMNFKAEKISLLTMHAAKGLEFKIVFLVGLEEDILPYRPPAKDPAVVEEERRLFYVAITRAQQRLFMTHALKRVLYGRPLKGGASPFLTEFEKRLKSVDKLPSKKQKKKVKQLDLF